MKYKMRALLSVIFLCLITVPSVGAAFAQNAPEQKQKPGIYLLSQTDIDSVKDDELKSVYRDADESLADQVRDGLVSRKINVTVVKSERDITETARFILVIRVDKIELGGKRPFGRTAKVKGVYSFQNKDRFDLVKRTHEETSVQKWQNCINKISEKIVADTAGDFAKQSVPQTVNDKQVRPKPATAGPSFETRLKELESLKAKGLVTEKEYEEKRKEILKEL